jgi:hypothetical protein
MNIQDIIEDLNEGDHNFLKYFDNDYQLLFKFLEKKDALKLLDPNNEEYQNPLLVYLQKADPEKFAKWVTHFLGDVKYENGKYYLLLDDREDLAKLFCETRNTLPQETIAAILKGEGDDEYFTDLNQNPYDDVISELTKSNLIRLKEVIIDDLKDKKVSPETILLEDIAREQGHPEYVIIDSEYIDYIVDNKETINHLLRNESELFTLENELSNVLYQSYNQAYADDLHEAVWSELSQYFIGGGEWITRPHTYKDNTQIQYFKVEIANFELEILNFLKDDLQNLEYFGNYIDVLKDLMNYDCLKVYPPDHPDHRKVDKNINEFFKDYI